MKQNNLILQKLQDIGLSEAESRLYLVGLELGPTTILNLSKVSEIKRTTIYGMIDILVAKGIFEIQIDGWKKLYTASSPQNLQNLIQKNYQNLLEIIPELDKINTKKETEIYLKAYSGSENLRKLYTKILTSLIPDTEYLILGNINLWAKAMGDFGEPFFVERERICRLKNIKIKALFIKDKYANLQKNREKLFGMEVRFLPKGTTLKTNYVTTANMTIFHQTVESNTAFETNNPYIIETQRELFNLLWGNN
jgi:sugar-specific transcriptional regulator TrmB